MAKESVCDMCRDPSSKTLRVLFNDEPRTLDLCEAHYDWFRRQSHPEDRDKPREV